MDLLSIYPKENSKEKSTIYPKLSETITRLDIKVSTTQPVRVRAEKYVFSRKEYEQLPESSQ